MPPNPTAETESTDTRHRKVAIIGSGPAGLTAAIVRLARQPGADRLRRQRPAGPADDHLRRGELPRISRRDPGTGADGALSPAGGALRLDDHGRRRHQGRLQRAALQAVGQGRPVPGRCGDRRHRRIGPVAGADLRGGVPRPRGQRLRHLRRLLLPRSGSGGGRWRRHGTGGGALPDQVRLQGHHPGAARRVPRQQDHAGPRLHPPQGGGALEHRKSPTSAAT